VAPKLQHTLQHGRGPRRLTSSKAGCELRITAAMQKEQGARKPHEAENPLTGVPESGCARLLSGVGLLRDHDLRRSPRG
jgi:hypothetical protein